MTTWMFIANPKDFANWHETEESYWDRDKYGNIVWGIPNNSRDVFNIKRVKVGDIILCYHTYYRRIIGVTKCTKRWYSVNARNGFGNCVNISPINFDQPFIRLKDLKDERFRFIISDYLHAPMGRAVVEVSSRDEPKFFRLYPTYHITI